MIIETILLQPADVKDWDIDCTPMFNNDDTDYVTEVTTTIRTIQDPVTLAASAVIAGPGTVKVWLSGAVPSVEWMVEVTVKSFVGREQQDELLVTGVDF